MNDKLNLEHETLHFGKPMLSAGTGNLLELFAGSRSVGKVGERLGYNVFSIDWKEYEGIDLAIDIGDLTKEDVPFVPDVVWASPDCFPKGTLIRTMEGYTSIEEIEVGVKVLTHENEYKNVYNTMSKTTEDIIKVKVSGSEEIVVTPEHPFWCVEKIVTYENRKKPNVMSFSEPKWVKASDLKKSHRVGIPINRESKVPIWGGIEHTQKNQTGFIKYTGVNKLNALMDNHNFWWVVGRYMGDGSFIYDEVNGRYEVSICCNKNNNETSDIKNILDTLPQFNYCISEKYTTNVFAISGKEFSFFIKQFGKGSEGKKITDDILNLPVELLSSFLEGYISADGYEKEMKNGNIAVSITTVSSNLAYGIQKCIHKAYGRGCSLTTKPACVSVIEGRDVNCKKTYTIRFYRDKHRRYYSIKDNYIWVNIKEVNKCKEATEVFNLSVEDHESYTVNNISVHNCTTYSIAACSTHRTNTKEPKSDYAKKCDTVNQHFIGLIKEWLKVNPDMVFFIENPRGMLRHMEWMQEFKRHTVWYCKYGDDRAKPTDIWTNSGTWKPRPMCRNYKYDKETGEIIDRHCHHESARRGTKTGTQGRKGSYERSIIPRELCLEVLRSACR